MDKLERVQSLTYRRMSQIDGELDRSNSGQNSTSTADTVLQRRFEELENLCYKLRRLAAPNPCRIMLTIFPTPAHVVAGPAKISTAPFPPTYFDLRQPTNQRNGGILSAGSEDKWPKRQNR